MYARILLLIMFISLTGCLQSTKQVSTDFAAKWQNSNIDDFVASHGAPYKAFNMNSGDTAFTWNSGVVSTQMPVTSNTTVTGNTTDYGYTTHYSGNATTTYSGGGSIDSYCEIQLIVDDTGKIKRTMILKDTLGLWALSRCSEVLR